MALLKSYGGRFGFCTASPVPGNDTPCTEPPTAAPDKAVQPVVVAPSGANLPFVHRAAAALRHHPILGRQMFGQANQ